MDAGEKMVLEQVELHLVCQRLKVVVKRELADFGVNPAALNVEAAINPLAIRNALIRDEFSRSRKIGIRAEELYCNLSIKYNLSFDRIISIVKNKE